MLKDYAAAPCKGTSKAYCLGKQELAGVTGAGAAAGAIVELHAMELEGYGPFRWLTKDPVSLHH